VAFGILLVRAQAVAAIFPTFTANILVFSQILGIMFVAAAAIKETNQSGT